MADPLAHLQYRRLDRSSIEQVTITEQKSGYFIDGTIEAQLQAGQVNVHYLIHTNLGWETQSVSVEVMTGSETRSLHLQVDELQRWWDEHDEIGALAGCQDVDLELSPVTNSLVINREKMQIGASRLVTAAWVRFPELELQPLSQRYTRQAEQSYLYENLASGFSALIQVDEFGLVVRYGDIWERV